MNFVQVMEFCLVSCCVFMIIKKFNSYSANTVFLQQTIWLFFRDMFKGILLAAIIGPPVVAAIIIIVQVNNFPLMQKNYSVLTYFAESELR